MALQPRRSQSDGPQWIAVYITHNLPEAHIILGKLEAHQVPAMIHQEAGATALGITFGNLGEIKILVSPSDYKRAEALLFAESQDEIEASNRKIQVIWDEDDDDE